VRNIHKGFILGAALITATGISRPLPAAANTTTDIAIAAGAIVGALLIDGNNHPYYVRDNHRYYVTQQEANYYRSHHHVVQRSAWVPENEYDVRRNAGYQVQQHQMSSYNHRDDQHHQ
jgi:hypothetical protein